MNNTVSIIVPVYCVEKYLPECLDSLIKQTYHDLDIILVDDESPDNSPEICDKYAQADSRISVYHIKNGGVSRARNFGLTKANGDWLMFLDSDDYLEYNAIEIMLEIANKTCSDIVSSSYYSTFVNKKYLVGNNDGKETVLSYDLDTFIHDMIVYPRMTVKDYPTCLVPWGKIIRRSVLIKNNITFKTDLHLHEDALFNTQVYKFVNKQAVIHKPLHYYRQRKNSSSKSRTKDYFLNNKKFCEYVGHIHDSCGNSLFNDEEYAVTCTKYFVYGMVNLWSYSAGNVNRAREQLYKYLNDPFFSEQLTRATYADISVYGFSDRLRISVDAARKKKIARLLLFAKLSDVRIAYSAINPFHRNKMFS